MGLQLTPGVEIDSAIPTIADQHDGTIELEFTQHLTRSAGEQRDGKMVEPGALETCKTGKAFEAQRIPSRSRASAHSKTGYICAGQTVILTFRLRQGGGPYIPVCRSYVKKDLFGGSAIILPCETCSQLLCY